MALPLRKGLHGTPGATRTRGLLLRRQSLYPPELRVHSAGLSRIICREAVFVNLELPLSYVYKRKLVISE